MILVHTGTLICENLRMNLVLHGLFEQVMPFIDFDYLTILSNIMVQKLDRILHFLVGVL